MGQELTGHGCTNPQNNDILGRQIEMYQWRANPNFNMHIARTSFKSASMQHQQELFAQFLQQYRSKQYIEIDKFKEELSQMSRNNNDKVVIFEHYRSTLKDLKGQLTFEQTMYVLYGLLIGYEQLKKVYQKIIVDGICCFVATEGAIRAWINPDPKSNIVWQGQFRQLAPQSSHNQIMLKIIKIVQASGRPSKRGNSFYYHLTTILNQNEYHSCSFSQLRKWINEYCFMHHIQMAQGITSCDKNIPRESRQSSRKSEVKNVRISTKQNNLFKSTIESQKNQNRSSILAKSRSIDRNMMMTGADTYNRHSEISNSNRASTNKVESSQFPQGKLHQSNSDIRNKKHSVTQNVKYSYIVQSNNYFGRESLTSLAHEKISEPFHSQGYKVSDILYNKIEEVPSVKSSSHQNKSSIQQLQQNVINVQLSVPNPKKQTILKKNDRPKQSLQASIINCVPQSNLQIQNQFCRPEGKHKTFFKDSSNGSASDIDNFSRPWITTKTITRLISSRDQISVKNSIAESSDYYNCSEYSGVLTQMGRDITKCPSNCGPKTLRVSREFQL